MRTKASNAIEWMRKKKEKLTVSFTKQKSKLLQQNACKVLLAILSNRLQKWTLCCSSDTNESLLVSQHCLHYFHQQTFLLWAFRDGLFTITSKTLTHNPLACFGMLCYANKPFTQPIYNFHSFSTLLPFLPNAVQNDG